MKEIRGKTKTPINLFSRSKYVRWRRERAGLHFQTCFASAVSCGSRKSEHAPYCITVVAEEYLPLEKSEETNVEKHQWIFVRNTFSCQFFVLKLLRGLVVALGY